MLTTKHYFIIIEALNVFVKTIFPSHSSYFFGVILHLIYCIHTAAGHTACSKDREWLLQTTFPVACHALCNSNYPFRQCWRNFS